MCYLLANCSLRYSFSVFQSPFLGLGLGSDFVVDEKLFIKVLSLRAFRVYFQGQGFRCRFDVLFVGKLFIRVLNLKAIRIFFKVKVKCVICQQIVHQFFYFKGFWVLFLGLGLGSNFVVGEKLFIKVLSLRAFRVYFQGQGFRCKFDVLFVGKLFIRVLNLKAIRIFFKVKVKCVICQQIVHQFFDFKGFQVSFFELGFRFKV